MFALCQRVPCLDRALARRRRLTGREILLCTVLALTGCGSDERPGVLDAPDSGTDAGDDAPPDGPGGGRSTTETSIASAGSGGCPSLEEPADDAFEGAAGAGGAGVLCTEPEGVELDSEAAVERFAERGCEVLDGSLSISVASLTDLNGLSPSPLRVVTEDVRIISNDALTDLRGLWGLERIEGSLIVVSNPSLESLAGLETLERLGTDWTEDLLVLTQNAELLDVTALSNVTHMMASITVVQNPSLPSLAWLEGLRTTGNLLITNNESLLRLRGLQDLECSRGSVTISSNPNLLSADLPSLRHSQALQVTSHGVMTSVDLSSLESVGDSLTIANNRELTAIGLGRLRFTGNAQISDNPMLPQCAVDAIAAQVGTCTRCQGNDADADCE